MPQDEERQWQGYVQSIRAVKSMEKLEEIEKKLFSRKRGIYTLKLKILQKEVTAKEKKEVGQKLNLWKERLKRAIAERRMPKRRPVISFVVSSGSRERL